MSRYKSTHNLFNNMFKKNLEYKFVLIISMLVFCLTFFYITYMDEFIIMPKCFLYRTFGIYCWGCGATRAVYSLLSGNILKSISYNPFILYLIVANLWYLITEGIAIALNLKNKFCIKNINFYVYVGFLILILNWIVKMIMLFNGYYI